MSLQFPFVRTVREASSNGLFAVAGWLRDGPLVAVMDRIEFLQNRYPNASSGVIVNMYAAAMKGYNAGHAAGQGATVADMNIPTGVNVPPGDKYAYYVTAVIDTDYISSSGVPRHYHQGDNFTIYSPTQMTDSDLREKIEELFLDVMKDRRADYELPPDFPLDEMDIYVSALARR